MTGSSISIYSSTNACGSYFSRKVQLCFHIPEVRPATSHQNTMNRSNSDTEADETMAAQQPSADEKGFAVEPKKDCPHANLPEYKKFDHNISGQ